MTRFGPVDFLRAAQFFRSGDLDDFAEIVPGSSPPPRTPAPSAARPESDPLRDA